MYGRYTRSLGEYAREQAKELRQLEKKCKAEEKQRTKELRTYRGKVSVGSRPPPPPPQRGSSSFRFPFPSCKLEFLGLIRRWITRYDPSPHRFPNGWATTPVAAV